MSIIEKVNEQLILTATIKKSTDDYYVAINNEIEYHIYHNSDPLLIYQYRRLIERSNVNKVKYSSDKIITDSEQLNNCSFTTYTNNDTLNNTLTIAIIDDNINLHRIFIYYANDGYVFNFTKESDGLTYSDVDNLYQLVIKTNNIVLYATEDGYPFYLKSGFQPFPEYVRRDGSRFLDGCKPMFFTLR